MYRCVLITLAHFKALHVTLTCVHTLALEQQCVLKKGGESDSGDEWGRVGYSGCQSCIAKPLIASIHCCISLLPVCPYRVHAKMDPGEWAHLSHGVQGCQWTGHKVSSLYPGLYECLECSQLINFGYMCIFIM